MFLIHILLPLYSNTKRKYPKKLYKDIAAILLKKFGGVTFYTQSPAEGLWDNGRNVKYDQLIRVEVMVEKLNSIWWKRYRKKLETDFKQEKVIVRSFEFKEL